MGTTHSDITQSQFKKFWRETDSLDNLHLWENKDNPRHKLQQYCIRNDDSPNFEQLYHLRKNNPYLVNAYALKHDGLSCGIDHETQNIFIQRIRLRLSNINDIPYPDALHLYDAVLHGYAQLSEVVGCFHVDEEQVGVNELGQVKVWLNTAFELSKITGKGINQSEMLQQINQLLTSSVDQSSFPQGHPTIVQYLSYPAPSQTFSEAHNRFANYIRQFASGQVPMAFACVEQAGGSQRIGDWCRSRGSYGFDSSNFRVSQRLQQLIGSKRLSTSSKLYQTGRVVNETVAAQSQQSERQPIQIINSTVLPTVTQGSQVVSNQQISVQNQNIARTIIATEQSRFPVTTQNVSVAPRNVEGEQLRANFPLAPVHQLKQSQVVTSYNPAVAYSPPRPVPVQFQPQRLVQQQINQNIEFVPPQSSQVRFQSQPQKIQFIQNVQRVPQNQGSFAQVQTQSVQVANQTPKFAALPPQLSQFSRQVKVQNSNIQQNDSRLQQQRVLSQTYEVKQNLNIVESSKPDDDLKASNDFAWQDYTKPNTFVNQAVSQNSRTLPDISPQKQYAPSQDGKSSAEFLALISQLKLGASAGKNQFNQVYSQVADTPASSKQNFNQSSKNIAGYPSYDTYSQQVQSRSGLDSSRQNQNFKYESQSYSFEPQTYSNSYLQKYSNKIDPDLQSDLAYNR